MLLAIASVSLTSCTNNDDGIYIPDPDNGYRGKIMYKGVTFPLKFARVEDMKFADNGYYYIVEMASNRVSLNTSSYADSYLYLEIYQHQSLPFSGEYFTNSDDKAIDYIDYYEGVNLDRGQVVNYKFRIADDQFQSGRLFLNNYQNGLLRTNFTFIDLDGYSLSGDYDGLFEFIDHYNRSAVNNYKSTATKNREKSKGNLRQLRSVEK
mgnify:CR=1 FL=1